jgi:D-alanyl-D-alanine carboxypeptidase
MHRMSHTFDKHGFLFVLKFIAAVVVLIVLAEGGSKLLFGWYFTPQSIGQAITDSLQSPLSTANTISARSFIVVESGGSIITSRNADDIVPIASLAKLMTAYIAMNTMSLSEHITLDASDTVDDPTKLFSPGQRISIGQSLYPLLMASSNGIATAIARQYDTDHGQPGAFVTLMNTEARHIGLTHTHFADPAGLSDNTVSTARDFASLTAYLLKNEPSIFDSTKTPETTVKDVSGTLIDVYNYNIFYDDPRFLGGKEGYTPDAGETMAAIFSLSGKPTIFIVLDSTKRAQDIAALLDLSK